MKHSPEYLRNQSRWLHASYRRNLRFANIFLLLWTIAFAGLLAASMFDRTAGMGWGFSSEDSRTFLLFVAAGGLLWLVLTIIRKFLLAYVRRGYGAEPID